MQFEFSTVNKIIFGPGSLGKIGKAAKTLGKRAFLIIGSGGTTPEKMINFLEQERMQWSAIEVSGEPNISLVQDALVQAKEFKTDLVVGFGGGSVIDTGKAVSIMLTNPGELIDYLEIVGQSLTLQNPSLPFIAIPTTAGTGSEVTKNAVISVPEMKVKVSLRSSFMFPVLAIVDPELTYSLPQAITASTGMDALTQVLEPYVSKKSNWFVDPFCREGLLRVSRSLRQAYFEGNQTGAREDMAWVSLLGGLSLANAGLGAVHGFAAPIGGMFSAPHGAVCARLLPIVVQANIMALKKRQPESQVLLRYGEIAKILTQNEFATLDDGIQWISDLCSDLQIPNFSKYGITDRDLPEIIQKAAVASSMQANPIPLTPEEMLEILEKTL